MADDEYNKKIESLQQYIPFLDNMIAQLRDPSRRNREQQLSKMESLHAMITDRRKKLKLETLNKCEDVITKLYEKVNHKPFPTKTEVPGPSRTEVPGPSSTPASPSPPPEPKDFYSKPLTIPTERLEPISRIQRVDIYSSAAESLRRSKHKETPQYRGKYPDLSKPPISLDDLKCLEVDVHEKINEGASLKELNDIRNKIATELIFEDIKCISKPPTTETVSTSTDKPKIAVIETFFDSSLLKSSPCSSKSSTDSPNRKNVVLNLKPKPPVKILKDEVNIFEKIDVELFQEKKKKFERRNSTGKDDKTSKSNEKKKEAKNIPDDKKSKNIDTHEATSRDKSIERKGIETEKKSDVTDAITKIKATTKPEPEVIVLDDPPKLVAKKDGSSTNNDIKDPRLPIRLADKFNPKPRKQNTDGTMDVVKAVTASIEANMKVSPVKLPYCSKPEPPPPPPASLVKCAQQIDFEFQNTQKNMRPIQPLVNNMVPRLPLLNNPHVSPSVHISPRDNLLVSPRDNFLMSPRDNFLMSPRDDFSNRRQHFESQPPLPRFIPNQPNQMFKNPQYNNFKQNFREPIPSLLDFQPPNNVPSNFNVGPPLLSPEVGHFHEQKHIVGGIANRDMYLPKEDLRWRLEENRPSWERRDYDPHRFNRGPMTYKEHRELIQTNRDPRLAARDPRERDRNFRDPRDNKEKEHRDEKDRDFRENKTIESKEKDNRDPRLNRDKLKDPKDKERESTDKTDKVHRDPRLNKVTERGRSKNRYDSKFDRMYSMTNKNHARSRSDSETRPKSEKEKEKEKETFTSPLDSLYTVKEEKKTGKGYGFQPFRIPKKKKEEMEPVIEQVEDDAPVQEDYSSEEELPVSKKELPVSKKDINNKKLSTEAHNDLEATVNTTAINVSSEQEEASSSSEQKSAGVSGEQNVAEEISILSGANSSTETNKEVKSQDDQPQGSSEIKEPKSEQTILAQFFKHLMSSQNKNDKKTALFSLITTFSDTFESDELASIKSIIHATPTDNIATTQKENSKDDIPPKPDETESTKDVEISNKEDKYVEHDEKVDDEKSVEHDEKVDYDDDDEKSVEHNEKVDYDDDDDEKSVEHDEKVEDDEIEPVAVSKPKLRSRRLDSILPVEEKTDVSETSVADENIETDTSTTDINPHEVVVSVGERIKSRKRNSNNEKPRKKPRTELDKLHEDIKEMFIRDGVLTASGKRMCNLLRHDPSALGETFDVNPEEVIKTRKKPGPKCKQKNPNEIDPNSMMRKMSVVLPKLPDNTLEEASVGRRLTRSMTLPEQDDIPSDSSKEDTDEEVDDTIEKNSDEKDALLSTESQKAKTIKRKRQKSSWASGIIRKKKKKTTDDSSSQPKTPERDDNDLNDFLPPDKNYYVEFGSKTLYSCKLCDFNGRFIANHYKTAHPESEVMCSRLSPSAALEAITDFNVNMDKYETYQISKPGVRVNYVCRFCAYSTPVVPTSFYDHLSTHTGEHRHICPNCSVSFCSGKSLKSHMVNNHAGEEKPIVRKCFSTVIMFGYLCGECNYVQINKSNLEEHVNIYHLDRPIIHKINLSSRFDDNIITLHARGEKLEQSKDNSEQVPLEQTVVNEEESDPKPKKLRGKKESPFKQKPKVNNEVPESLKDAPPERKKPGPKPGPKSQKKMRENKAAFKQEKSFKVDKSKETVENNEPAENTSLNEAEVNDIPPSKSAPEKPRHYIRGDAALNTETILPLRSKRAAKEKAQEKLKVIMEMNDRNDRKKNNSDETKKANESQDLNSNKNNEQRSRRSSLVTPLPEETEEPSKKDNASENKVNDKEGNASENKVNDKEDNASENKVNDKEDNKEDIKKEFDLNVFTCNTDLQEENKMIELERLQKMDELNKEFGSRTSLNFVDKLCNRLNRNDVSVKEEPKDDFVDNMYQSVRSKSPVAMPVLEKNPPTTNLVPSVPAKKPVFESEIPPSTNFDVAQKNDESIKNMIEKLRGKLDADDNFNLTESQSADNFRTDSPPPLTHINELSKSKPSDTSTKILDICGLLKVFKTDTAAVFSCLVPPCVFSTENKDQFQKHCKENHKDGVSSRTSTLCEICGLELNGTPEVNLLEKVFEHMITEHTDLIKIDPKPPGRMLRLRRLSGDALSERKNQAELAKVKEETVNSSINENGITEINSDVTPNNDFPICIIADVVSLAPEQPELPPLVSITPKPIALTVKEAKMSSVELSKPKKCQRALLKFVDDASNLYKCPHYYCLFSTNFREYLERHMKAHNTDKDVLIACVYCDLKTPWEHVPIHIDIRHGNCKYACSYCLYRACLKNYVFLHQDRLHPFQDYSVVSIPSPKSQKKFAVADPQIDPKTLCEPFKCLTVCKVEYLFENEFTEHLSMFHQGFLTCGHNGCTSRIQVSKMVQHWSTCHAVSVYQCGYCKTNSNELNLMYHHLSQSHQNLNPEIYVRIITPKPDRILGYSNEAFKRMRKINTLPNIMEGEKDASPPLESEESTPPSTVTTTSQAIRARTVFVPAPKVIGSGKATNANNLYLITSSSIGALSVNTSAHNSIAKINTLQNSPVMTGSTGQNSRSLLNSAQVNNSSGQTSTVSPSPSISKPSKGRVTGYILFSRDARKRILQSNPKIEFGVISRIVGSEWNALSPADKYPWEEKAIILNEEKKKAAELLEQMQTSDLNAPIATSPVPPSDLITPNNAMTLSPVQPNIESLSTVVSTLESSSSVVPLEHVTLSAETSQGEIAENDVDPLALDIGDGAIDQNVGDSSEDESDATKSRKESELPLDIGQTPTVQIITYSSEDDSDSAKSKRTNRYQSVGNSSEDESDSAKSKKKFGLLGYQLYRCAFCDFSCTNTQDFKKHAAKSINCKSQDNLNKPYVCVHCKKSFRNYQILTEHIQCHGVLRYACSLCGNKFPTSSQARLHMKQRHSISQPTQAIVNPSATPGNEEYIIKPKLSEPPAKEVVAAEFTAPAAVMDIFYQPDEIDKIPIRSIFSTDLRCGVCTYSTKVRTNMVRHLQFHSQEKAVPDSAPVNPVPCLDRQEKMFDKMVNLASSSHKGRMGGGSNKEKEVENIPEFISSSSRYTCCAQGCNYTCPEEGNLRHHLIALHDGETSFICVHCKATLPADADSLIKHLKLHGLQLYKCQHCSFVHNQKHKTEKHSSDTHVDLPSKVVTIRNMESEPIEKNHDDASPGTSTAGQSQTKSNKPWRCLMCKFRSTTEDGVGAHVLEKHEIDTQYKCALCSYKSNEKTTFSDHYKEHHPKQDIDIISSYRKIEEENKEEKDGENFDTTPLWQRDRPRVKHIRGILFDEATPSKSPKKSTKAPSSSSSKGVNRNLDLAIEAVASGSGKTNKDEEKDLIDKVNKLFTLTPISPSKDSSSDIIVIEDEDESSKPPVKRKSVDELTSQIVKLPKLEEITEYKTEEDNSTLRLGLKNFYGDFGIPLHKQLKCPVCNQFKSKRMSDFIFHVFKEKKIYRFKCGVHGCGDESITYRYMSKHLKEHNKPFETSQIIQMDKNLKLELWIQMVILEQCKRIVPVLQPLADVPFSATQKFLCRFCNKWYKTEPERNEHTLVHWSCMPYKCSECGFTAYTRSQVENHFSKLHANNSKFPQDWVLEIGPTVAGELQHTDYMHMKEAGELPVENKASIAEVMVPATTIPDNMVDESEQDGTVQNMVLDTSLNVPEPMETSYEPFDDLVIVSKTDTNVPHSGDVFCCEYCPYMSDSESLMLSHISGQHEHMHIKFKVINYTACETKKEDYVACTICHEMGSEIKIRQHFMNIHEGGTFSYYRYTCNSCQRKFIRMPGLKMHSQRVHPGVNITFTGLFNNVFSIEQTASKQKNTKEKHKAATTKDSTPDRNLLTVLTPTTRGWKRYQCTECSYQRDFPPSGANNVRCHVRTHFKAYLCGACGLKFKGRTDCVSHFRKDHSGMEEQIIQDKDAEDSFQECMRIINSEAEPIPDPSSFVPEVKGKATARKSTSTMHLKPMEEFSYYGEPTEEQNLHGIMTTVEINGICLDMTADKLGKIFNLDTYVPLAKCDAEPEENEIIEIDS